MQTLTSEVHRETLVRSIVPVLTAEIGEDAEILSRVLSPGKKVSFGFIKQIFLPRVDMGVSEV